jgi:ABC-type lipoprotein release transport system permease subunit
VNLLSKLAWRNIWRNKRRSVITIAAVTFAALLTIVMRGVQLGTYAVNIEHFTSLFMGTIQVQAIGFKDNPTLQRSFRVHAEITDPLDRHPLALVQGYAPRLIGDGLATFKESAQGAMLIGLDPAAEKNVSTIASRVHEGRFIDDPTSDDVVLGQTLMQNLKASIGDQIVILAQGFDGSLGNQRFTIVGSVRTGMPAFDRAAVFMGLEVARELLVMDGKASILALKLSGLEQIPETVPDLRASLEGRGVVVLPWNEVMRDLEQGIEMDNVSGVMTLGILIVVVAFGITNTVLMSVTERFREFGIILAMGMPQRKLVVIVFIETAIIVGIGLAMGNLLGYAVNAILVANPITFTGEFAELYEVYGFLPRLESTLRPDIFINMTLSVAIVSLLATLYPLSKLMRLEPLKGIRHT